VTIVGEGIIWLRPSTAGFAEEAEGKLKSSLAFLGGGSSVVGGIVAGTLAAGAAVTIVTAKMAMDFQSAEAKLSGTADISAKAAAKIGTAFLNTMGSSAFSGETLLKAYTPVSAQLARVEGRTLSATQATRFMAVASDLAKASGKDLNTSTSTLAQTLFTFGIRTKDAAGAANLLFNAARITNTPIDSLSNIIDKLHAKLGTLAPTLKDTASIIALPSVAALGSRGAMQVSSALEHLLTQASATSSGITKAVTAAQAKLTTASADVAKAQLKQQQAQEEVTASGTNTLAQQIKMSNAQDAVTAAVGKQTLAQQALTAAQGDNVAGSTQAKALLDQLGLSSLYVHGKFVGLREVIATLGPRLAAMTEQNRNLALQTLFGTGAAQVMGHVLAGGVTAFDKSTAAVSRHNALAHAAAAIAKTLFGQLDVLRASVEDVAVKLGQMLLPYIQKFVHLLTEGFGWALKHKEVMIALAGVLAGIVVGSLMAVAAALLAVDVAGLPIWLIAAAIAALAVGVFEAYKHIPAFRDEVHKLGDDIKRINWKDVERDVKSFAKVVGKDLTEAFRDASAWLKEGMKIFDALPGPLKDIVSPILGIVVAVKFVAQHWKAAFTDIDHATRDFVGGLEAAWRDFLDPIVQWVVDFWHSLVNFWHTYGGEITRITRGLFGLIESVVRTFIHVTTDISKALFDLLIPIFRAGWALVKGVFQAAWDLIVGVVKVAWRTVEGVMEVAKDVVLGIFEIFVSLLTGHWSKAWKALVHMVVSVKSDIVNAAKGVLEAVLNAVGRAALDLYKGAFAAGKDLVMGLWKGIKEAAHLATDAVKSVGHGILSAAKSVLGIFSPSIHFQEYGKGTMQGLAKGIRDNANLPQAELNKLNLHIAPKDKQKAVDWFKDVAKLAKQNHESAGSAAGQLAHLFGAGPSGSDAAKKAATQLKQLTEAITLRKYLQAMAHQNHQDVTAGNKTSRDGSSQVGKHVDMASLHAMTNHRQLLDEQKTQTAILRQLKIDGEKPKKITIKGMPGTTTGAGSNAVGAIASGTIR